MSATQAPAGRWRALLAVSDKRGVVGLGAALAGFGWEIAATEGTARMLAAAGVPVVDVAALAGVPPLLGGRIKTLTLEIFAGILMRQGSPADCADARRLAIAPFHLVTSSFYALDETRREADAVDCIDVGGPAMLRAAAKNHADVLPLCDPGDYTRLVAALADGGGDPRRVAPTLRRELAAKAFERTAAYDRALASWLRQKDTEAVT